MRLLGMYLYLFSLSASFASTPPTCAELNKMWAIKYHSEFKIAWKKQSFKCPGKNSRIAEAIYYLDNIKFTGLNPPDFYSHVVTKLSKFKYRSIYELNENTRATEIYGIITVYDGFANDKNVLRRVKTLVHEGRHLYRDDPGHVLCTSGTHKGKNACDQNFYDIDWKGSGYNYSFKYYKYFLSSSSNHKLDKKEAKFRMKQMIMNRFNNVSNAMVKKYSR